MTKIGIIGGSGLDNPDFMQYIKSSDVHTPYGDPSSEIIHGKINGVNVVILSRHGKKHHLSPTEVNYRANVYALIESGATHIVATTACGSLREEIGRGDFVIPDQFIDFTRHRKNTFFDSFKNGARHCAMADPFNTDLRNALIETAKELDFKYHPKGTVMTIEGPRFSTRAESNMFRILGGDIINMSIAPEAALANECNIPYAAVAMSTDYDCWKTDEEPVSWEEIMAVFKQNAENMKKILIHMTNKVR
ncbi:MAG: S-methyl-5'-thioadenosine phosphorylase [Proteobacteria bacterium]|nr:S-methyl-5'-thioadenosine phosphorylase [Pseudomonadota bacterium]